MVKFRQVPTPEEGAFIDKAKTGEGARPATEVVKPLPIPTNLNPRIIKQVNLTMPETDHFELKALVATLPSMSMHRFIMEAIAEKIARVKGGSVPE